MQETGVSVAIGDPKMAKKQYIKGLPWLDVIPEIDEAAYRIN